MKSLIILLFTSLILFSCNSKSSDNSASEDQVQEDTLIEQNLESVDDAVQKNITATKSTNKKLGPYYQKVIDQLGITENQARALRDINSKYKNQRVGFQSQGKWAGKENTSTRKNWFTQKENETIKLIGQDLYDQLKSVK